MNYQDLLTAIRQSPTLWDIEKTVGTWDEIGTELDRRYEAEENALDAEEAEIERQYQQAMERLEAKRKALKAGFTKAYDEVAEAHTDAENHLPIGGPDEN